MSDPTNPYTTPPATPHQELELTPSNDDRNLALIAHLSGCAGIVLGGFVGFIGPLVVYLLKKDTSPYVESQAKEALNFQITLLILAVGCLIVTIGTCGFTFPLMLAPVILQIVFGIIAALAVRDGSPYRYPFNIRLFQ